MILEMHRDLGLAKNEAQIYEALLMNGESSVGAISNQSGVHRRNVYDSLKRLLEKGLVFEIFQKGETHFQAVDPQKLNEVLEEKRQMLNQIMPKLASLYNGKRRQEEAFIYRGIEGYKNEMRDILRIRDNVYTLGGKGVWADPNLKRFVEPFIREARRNKIKFQYLLDGSIKGKEKEIVRFLGPNYRFLPAAYSTKARIDIFGDHVVLFSKAEATTLSEDIRLTVVINPRLADAFRTWFNLIWHLSPNAG